VRAALRAQDQTGESLRSIAERTGVSPASVSKIARDMGVEQPKRSQTKKATEALRADLAARRAEISKRMVDAAERALDDMESPAKIYNFGGKDNTYNEREVPRPPTGDQRNLMIIAATALDKHRMLDQYDAQQGLAAVVDDWLGDMLGRRGQEGDASA